MLCLPDTGFQRSVREHNVKLDILVDWIEGSVAFIDEELSQTDVIDVLRENGIYREQGDLFERLTAECLEYLGWTVFRPGWAPENAARLKTVVENVSAHIGEPQIPDALEK